MAHRGREDVTLMCTQSYPDTQGSCWKLRCAGDIDGNLDYG